MKRILLSLFVTGFLPCAVFGDSRYPLVPVGDDARVVRTKDGAELGRLEYLILEPTTRRVVATVTTGGIVGDQEVVVPFKGVRFEGSRQVVLTDISRERVMSAQPVERVQLTTSGMISESVVNDAFEHFGVETKSEAERATSAATKPGRGEDTGEVPPPTRQESRSKAKQGAGSDDVASGDAVEDGAGSSHSSATRSHRRR
ncbi:PRC-barrel domain-containing protein [Verrucomicrobiota bacterium sgz303538]